MPLATRSANCLHRKQVHAIEHDDVKAMKFQDDPKGCMEKTDDNLEAKRGWRSTVAKASRPDYTEEEDEDAKEEARMEAVVKKGREKEEDGESLDEAGIESDLSDSSEVLTSNPNTIYPNPKRNPEVALDKTHGKAWIFEGVCAHGLKQRSDTATHSLIFLLSHSKFCSRAWTLPTRRRLVRTILRNLHPIHVQFRRV